MKQPHVAVATNLKRIRESRNLSLEQLAELTSVSKSMLRQVETGKSSPSISTLWKIANGLRVSFSTLLNAPAPKVEVRSFAERQPLTGASEQYRLFPLIPFDPQHGTETYYVEMESGTRFSGEPHEGQVTEHFFVFEGRLEVSIRDQHYSAEAGQYMQFLADCPHEYLSTGKELMRAIMQLTYLG